MDHPNRDGSETPHRSDAEAEEPLRAFRQENVRPALTVVDLNEWTAGRDPLAAFQVETPAEERSDYPDDSDYLAFPEDEDHPFAPAKPAGLMHSALAHAAATGRRSGRFVRELPSLRRQFERDYWRPVGVVFRRLQVAALTALLSPVVDGVRAWDRFRRVRRERLRARPAIPTPVPIRTPRAISRPPRPPAIPAPLRPPAIPAPRTTRPPRTVRAIRTRRTVRTTGPLRVALGFAGLLVVAVGAIAALNSIGAAVGRWLDSAATAPAIVEERTAPVAVTAAAQPDAVSEVTGASDRTEAIVETPVGTANEAVAPAPLPSSTPNVPPPAVRQETAREVVAPPPPARQDTAREAVVPPATRPAPSRPAAGPPPVETTRSLPPQAPAVTQLPRPVPTQPAPQVVDAGVASRRAEVPPPAIPRPTATTGVTIGEPTANNPAAPPAAPAATPSVAANSVPSAAPPPLAPAAAAAPAATPSAAGAPAAAAVAIESVLNRYAFAFSMLDAARAKAVWPTVNERSLERAFDSLESQKFDLGACDISVTAPRAVASCEGTAHYAPKVGNRKLRSERRRWTFQLQQRGQDWAIESVDSR